MVQYLPNLPTMTMKQRLQLQKAKRKRAYKVKLMRQNRLAKKREKSREHRRKRLEWKRMSRKQRLVKTKQEDLRKEGRPIAHEFLGVLNLLRVTDKIPVFYYNYHEYKYWWSSNQICDDLANGYSEVPDIPPKGNPSCKKQRWNAASGSRGKYGFCRF